jgi:8-oxo-dGTP pyrophosphatase MutT (NUDIX family)
MIVHVVAAVIEREGRLLLCERPKEKRHGGLWEFPGGKMEDGETHLEAVRREHVLAVGPTEFSRRDPGSPFVIEFLPTQVEGEPQCLEHSALQWVEPARLLSFPLAPSDEAYVRHRLSEQVPGASRD